MCVNPVIWVFPKIGVPQNGWFIMENAILYWMIWGYPYFWKYPYSTVLEILETSRMNVHEKKPLLNAKVVIPKSIV